MKDTGFYVPASKRDRFVALKAYDSASKSLVAPSGPLVFDYSRPPGTASGGAGLVSTASDYLRFAQMLLNGGELDWSTVRWWRLESRSYRVCHRGHAHPLQSQHGRLNRTRIRA
jgi:CubicO group peptidase (beta-lactamase class C family)